jgi:hypothetical protein
MIKALTIAVGMLCCLEVPLVLVKERRARRVFPLISLLCVCLYSAPASADQNLSDTISAYLLDAIIAQGKLRWAKNYKIFAEQPCISGLSDSHFREVCIPKATTGSIQICDTERLLKEGLLKEGDGPEVACKYVEISSLVEQNIQKLFTQSGPGSSQSKVVLLNIYRLAWIQYILYEPFSRFASDEIDSSQIESLNAFVKSLSYTLLTTNASDKDVINARDQISRIVDDAREKEIARLKAENRNAEGPITINITGPLLAKIRSTFCPLWPVCDK